MDTQESFIAHFRLYYPEEFTPLRRMIKASFEPSKSSPSNASRARRSFIESLMQTLTVDFVLLLLAQCSNRTKDVPYDYI